MKEQRVIFPKTTPQWLRERVKQMEYKIEEFERKHERMRSQLSKTQEDFQDLLDLVELIAKDDKGEPAIQADCQKMVERFNPGSYENDVS